MLNDFSSATMLRTGEQACHRLIVAIQEPRSLEALSIEQLQEVLQGARQLGLLANLAERADRAGVQLDLAKDWFVAAKRWAAEHRRRVSWELKQLSNWVASLDCPVLVLKGGAYLAMDLISARGRLLADVDLMVPRSHLGRIEQMLLGQGYRHLNRETYDQFYYRAWMHELPPLMHIARGTVLDLHHNIAAPVSRLKIDSDKLFERMRPLQDLGPFMRLGDEDLVLHLCVHLFHDGELRYALRELFDLECLLQRFSQQTDYWSRLSSRANELGLQRPLFYALWFLREFLRYPVPQYLFDTIPRPIWRSLTLAAMRRVVVPERAQGGELGIGWGTVWGRRLSEHFLLMRAHWLRMPPGLLMRHLHTQVRRRGGIKTKR